MNLKALPKVGQKYLIRKSFNKMFEDVIALYSYTEEEQRDFKYLHDYMSRIAPKTETLLRQELHRNKYIIAGLFLTYRACNHMGISMSSKSADELLTPHKERLSNFIRFTGHEIKSTKHYLKIVGFNPLLLKVLFKNPGTMLYRFVASKKSINW